MWMMGYNGAGDFDMSDFFGARMLGPAVVPRSLTMAFADGATGAPPCLGRVHGADIFALNHHLATNNANEQNKRELSVQEVMSSRWNPTPEQLRVLEDLYRRGTRTPSPEQIQSITAQLRRYGKIEGKNVFYWFQNHKARERQKRRRQMELSSTTPKQQNNGGDELQTLEIRNKESTSGARGTLIIEEEQINTRATTIDCTTFFQKSEKASAVAECTAGEPGWLRFKETELGLHYRKNYSESSRNATRHMMQMPCGPPQHEHEPTSPTHLIINTTLNKTIDQCLIKTKSPRLVPHRSSQYQYGTTIDNNHLINVSVLNSNNHAFANETCGYYYHYDYDGDVNGDDDGNDDYNENDDCNIIDNGGGGSSSNNNNGNDFQTLQLFPLRRSSEREGNGSDQGMHAEEKEMDVSLPAFNHDNLITSSDNVVPTHHFFEFLPLKN